MIKKVYHYLFYRTYQSILKTNKTSSETSSARLLSIAFFVNIFSVYFFVFKSFDKNIFFAFCAIGFFISILNLRYLNDAKCKLIIYEFKSFKANLFCKYLVDSYYYLSFFILFVSLGFGYAILLLYLGAIILINLATYFWKM